MTETRHMGYDPAFLAGITEDDGEARRSAHGRTGQDTGPGTGNPEDAAAPATGADAADCAGQDGVQQDGAGTDGAAGQDSEERDGGPASSSPDSPALDAGDVPVPSRPELTVLDYTHFSVHQDIERRMAAITAVNIDGTRLRNVGRSNDWRLDDRLPAEHQAGNELYRRNDLDRGHLVRRRDPVWGPDEVARRANSDTFHYTVCAPQAAYFNQSQELWLGVEDHVLSHARTRNQRLSVFTGCLFTEEDPTYRGFRIPKTFFKVVAWNARPAEDAVGGGETDMLASTAYLLDQAEGLDRILRRGLRPGEEAEGPGPFRTFQVPVADVAELSDLDFGQLTAADRYRVPAAGQDASARSLRAVTRWKELGSFDDITL